MKSLSIGAMAAVGTMIYCQMTGASPISAIWDWFRGWILWLLGIPLDGLISLIYTLEEALRGLGAGLIADGLKQLREVVERTKETGGAIVVAAVAIMLYLRLSRR